MIPGHARADHHPLQLVQPGTEAVDRKRCLKLNLDTLLAQPLCLLLQLLTLAGVDHGNGMARGLQEAGSTLTRAPKSDNDCLGHRLQESQMLRAYEDQ